MAALRWNACSSLGLAAGAGFAAEVEAGASGRPVAKQTFATRGGASQCRLRHSAWAAKDAFIRITSTALEALGSFVIPLMAATRSAVTLPSAAL